MIEYASGDMLKADVEALVNTVNCVGVMGRGIALQFKNAFPENFKAYALACKKKEVLPGKMFVYATGTLHTPYFIINFPTKRHWRGKSRLEDIDAGLADLARVVRHYSLHSLAIPPLGSGLGGLEWDVVKKHIEKALADLDDVQIRVYEPHGAPAADKMIHPREVPQMTPGRAALVGLMDRYLRGLLDPFVTLLEVHKLMYFMQEAGEPLRMHFRKGPYGPYADNLRHVLALLEGHMVSGYADGGDSPGKHLELVPGAVLDAKNFLRNAPDTQAHFDKVGELVAGFESPFGLELLSTVHWIATRQQIENIDKIVECVYRWNTHKRQFTPRQVERAFHTLSEKNWLSPKA